MPRLLPCVLLLLALAAGACGTDPEPTALPEPRPARTEASGEPSRPQASRGLSGPRATTTPSGGASAPDATGRDPRTAPPVGRPVTPSRGDAGAAGATGDSAPDAHLLAAGLLPGPAGTDWTLAADGDEGRTVAGGCHKTPLVTIGAVEAVRRVHTGGRDARATQVVALFADSKSAWRAHRVLVAWHDDCEQRAGRTVGPLRELSVATGVAGGYATTSGSGPATVTGLGMLRAGRWLAVVELAAGGRSWAADRPADAAERAAALAVRRVARTFAV